MEKRVCTPSGIWTAENLIGAKVVVTSVSIANFFNGLDCDVEEEIEDIFFRISTDGRAICVVKVKGKDNLFTLKDLEFTKISKSNEPSAGSSTAGNLTCGGKEDE